MFKVFVDGKLNGRREYYTLMTMPGFPMHVGASWNTATGANRFFSGSLARLRVYDYARTPAEIEAAALVGAAD